MAGLCIKVPASSRVQVRDGQTHPQRPRLVVSHSTCPPLSMIETGVTDHSSHRTGDFTCGAVEAGVIEDGPLRGGDFADGTVEAGVTKVGSPRGGDSTGGRVVQLCRSQ
jgi:hypothetical protein